MVNFGPPDTVPVAYKGRLVHAHNPQVTLMRMTAAARTIELAVGSASGVRRLAARQQ